jgi:hypothetical protein
MMAGATTELIVRHNATARMTVRTTEKVSKKVMFTIGQAVRCTVEDNENPHVQSLLKLDAVYHVADFMTPAMCEEAILDNSVIRWDLHGGKMMLVELPHAEFFAERFDGV